MFGRDANGRPMSAANPKSNKPRARAPESRADTFSMNTRSDMIGQSATN